MVLTFSKVSEENFSTIVSGLYLCAFFFCKEAKRVTMYGVILLISQEGNSSLQKRGVPEVPVGQQNADQIIQQICSGLFSVRMCLFLLRSLFHKSGSTCLKGMLLQIGFCV